MNPIFRNIKDLLIGGNNIRTIKVKKHILLSLLAKTLSILIGFLLVPLTIDYLDEYKYGIWITVSSIIAWFQFFDIGMGNGLRNRLAESLALNDLKKSRIYVSTTYIIMMIAVSVLFIAFFFVNMFVDWSRIINADAIISEEISLLALIVFSYFCLNFVLRLINTVLTADQRPGLVSIFKVTGRILTLIAIIILKRYTNDSLIYLGLVNGLFPLLILAGASYCFYRNQYKILRPAKSYFRIKYVKSLMNIGLKFFIINIATLIMFSTDNVIISKLFDPSEVTPYSIAHKYFSLIAMLFQIVITPFWSAFTEAFAKQDLSWIKRTLSILMKIWLGLFVLNIVMLIFSEPVYRFWIGTDINIPFRISWLMSLFFSIKTFGNIYVNLINGVGKVKLQYYTAIAAAVLNIPLSVFFAKYLNLGPAGVILATTVCILYGPILAPIQSRKILNGKATGIWNK